ncbi:myotubularin-related protein 4 [Eurytemora carolleeae]|uniref:myotubularin-related protein 4 n=1 Tax=Eurytemora carolleeae TaxID=1294199 RepID=UPI000C7803A0|nr:myotubularin-related protein 4 [Eurytemora carolleeae]|eukprot:XP_023340407.1 myotubularin-related protein 4-like [Eurytemora affinis]
MFTMVQAAEAFPIREPIKEREDLVPLYPPLPGESILYLGETRKGCISLSNYRLYVTVPPGFINIPLGLIDQIEVRDMFFLQLYCKDGRYYRIQFGSSGSCEEWTKRLLDEMSPPVKIEDIFAFGHLAWSLEGGVEEGEGAGEETSWFRAELARLRFDLQGAWRVSMVNQEHKLCPTYPQELLLPACISDAMLEKVGQFRSSRRIPAVVWRNSANGAVLARCSQPEVGWLGWRSSEDEELVRAIADASAYDSGRQRTLSESSSNWDASSASSLSLQNGEIPSLKDLSAEVAGRSDVKKVLIMDARSYAAAVGNRARGGGVECQEYYNNAEILFMNLANIHSIRKSFVALRVLCHSSSDQTSWFQGIDATKWLHHISGLLKAAVRCATALQVEGRSVIVHCSDGWDRTPQIASLAQLILDPYYRTMEGFQVLVEKEWLDFGHKMADRCGQGLGTSDPNERSPIFLQWLDCVHQLLLQFPVSFQFNLTFLFKIVQHTYSNIVGTFLANSLNERRRLKIRERTRSIWSFLRSHPIQFRNFLFVRKDEVLWPKCEVRDLLVWTDLYIGEGCGEGGTTTLPPSPDCSSTIPPSLNKERSRESSGDSSDNREDWENGEGREGGGGGEEEEGRVGEEGRNGHHPPPPPPPPYPHKLDRKSHIESSTDTLVGEPLPSPPVFNTSLDSDGLAVAQDEVQKRMVVIFSQHQVELSSLKRDLYMSRMALTQAGLVPVQPSTDELQDSRSGVESATSEVSWEAIDEGETRPTLWVPDHAASACMGCSTQFWFGRRKHHCRSCGRLFCSECSEQSVPIPAEQLYQPVRVCDTCYDELTADRQTWSKEKILEFEIARENSEKARENAVKAREAVDKPIVVERRGENGIDTVGKKGNVPELCDKLCSSELAEPALEES